MDKQGNTNTAKWIRAGLTALALLAMAAPVPSAMQAKEWDLEGTVDCYSGCLDGDMLAVWSDSYGSEMTRVVVDISWIRKKLPDLDDQDKISLTVEDLGGHLQATGVSHYFHVDGTFNGGRSTASNKARENNRQEKERNKEEDTTLAGSPPDPTPTPDPTIPTPTATPDPTIPVPTATPIVISV